MKENEGKWKNKFGNQVQKMLMDEHLRYDEEGVSKRFLEQRVKSALACESSSCEESSLQNTVVHVWSRRENMNGGVCRKEEKRRRKIRGHRHKWKS